MVHKGVIFLLCLAVVALANGKDLYSDKYDNINIPEILENERLFLAYVDCLLDKGKCTPEGKELRNHMSDALETGCSKCTEAQKKGTSDVIKHLIKYKIEIWNELCEKYDPQGKYRKEYEDKAKADGIEIPK